MKNLIKILMENLLLFHYHDLNYLFDELVVHQDQHYDDNDLLYLQHALLYVYEH
jgi:hypothetical protein